MTLSLVKQPFSSLAAVAAARVDVTFDSSYLTGGELLVPSDLGFTQIVAVIPVGTTPAGRTVQFTGTTLKVLEPAPLAKLRTYAVAGGAAGDHTATGALATDTLVSVQYFATTAGAVTSISELKADTGSVLATDKWQNPGGTATTSGFLWIVTTRPSDHAVPQEVPSTTDLHLETISLLVLGIK